MCLQLQLAVCNSHQIFIKNAMVTRFLAKIPLMKGPTTLKELMRVFQRFIVRAKSNVTLCISSTKLPVFGCPTAYCLFGVN